MAHASFNNVFKGPNSVIDYFNPDLAPPLPLVEVPAKLNPLRRYNVRIYAKMLTALPAQNVKALPALNMLLHKPEAASKSVVEASSGSTVLSLAMVSRVLWGNEDVTAYVTNKKHPDSLKLLRFFGLKVSLYGGLAQQEPVDPRGIMCRLRRLANKDEDIVYPGQYDNDNNWKAHVRWTGAQIYRQLPEINVLCTTVGTGGCIAGTGVYLKGEKPSVKVVGVCNVFGDPTPGPRHFPGFESSQFPWRETIDTFETVASVDSYEMSMQLSREGIICGPSSGEALCGLLNYLQKAQDAGKLQELADPTTGEISCVFICCDLPYQYMDGYFQKLAPSKFPDIHNEILLTCDQDKYDERWELSAKQARRMFAPKLRLKRRPSLCNRHKCATQLSCSATCPPNAKIIDLRQCDDFNVRHLRGALNSPLKGLSEASNDIFGDAGAVHMHWTGLRAKFAEEADRLGLNDTPVLIVCYDGETSRLATSILRARGCTAYSVFGGFAALREHIDKAKSYLAM